MPKAIHSMTGYSVATVELPAGPITLDCTRVDMAGWTYQGSMKLDLKPGGLGTGEIVLTGQNGLGPLTFALQTQLQGQTFVALGKIEPGTDISQISAQVTGQLTGPPQGLTQGTAGIEIGISMRARFANGRTPGDGSCTGRFAN